MKTKVLTLLGASALFLSSASAITVDLELALMTDVSSSMNQTEWENQRDGYVAAFQNAALHQAIIDSPNGIAVAYMEFADTAAIPWLPFDTLNWTKITDAAGALNFAAEIAKLTRVNRGGRTQITNAINFAKDSILNNDFEGTRKVIDISGDGKDNVLYDGGSSETIQLGDAAGFAATGAQTKAAALAAIGEGISAINGLPFDTATTDGPDVAAWYSTYVATGAGAFTLPATDQSDLKDAILAKIITEVIEKPVPDSGTTAALLGFGLLALAAVRRRMHR